MDIPEKPISEAEAAQHLGISLETLRKDRRAREGPPHTTIGRRPGYLKPFHVEWLRDGCNARRKPSTGHSYEDSRRGGVLGVPLHRGWKELLEDPRRKGRKEKPGRRQARDWRTSPRPALGFDWEETEKPVN